MVFGMVEGFIDRINDEVNDDCFVVATGGVSMYINL
jgi:type III pantothenate kinase